MELSREQDKAYLNFCSYCHGIIALLTRSMPLPTALDIDKTIEYLQPYIDTLPEHVQEWLGDVLGEERFAAEEREWDINVEGADPHDLDMESDGFDTIDYPSDDTLAEEACDSDEDPNGSGHFGTPLKRSTKPILTTQPEHTNSSTPLSQETPLTTQTIWSPISQNSGPTGSPRESLIQSAGATGTTHHHPTNGNNQNTNGSESKKSPNTSVPASTTLHLKVLQLQPRTNSHTLPIISKSGICPTTASTFGTKTGASQQPASSKISGKSLKFN